MNGLYDILESYKQQNDPRFIYEGLYEQPAYTGPNIDPMYNLGARQFGNMQRMDFGVPQQATGIMQQAPTQNFQQAPTQNFEFLSSAYEDDDAEQVDSLTDEKKSGGILDLIMSIAIPGYGFLKNIGKGGLEGIRGLNQRIQQSDFAQADNLMDYLDMRKYGGAQGRRDTAARNMAQARGIQNKIDTGEYRRTGVDNVIDRGRTQESRAAATRSRDLGSMRGGVGR